MSKTVNIEQNYTDIKNFLDKYFSTYTLLTNIDVGHHSKTCSFMHNNKQYIVRRSKVNYNYKKDQRVSLMLGDILPVPKVLMLKKYGDYFYCVQNKVRGVTADKILEEEYKLLLPQIFESLHKIHSFKIDGFTGFGTWDSKGVAPFDTWAEYLDDVHNEEKWENLSKSTKFNLKLISKLYLKLAKLLPHIESEQALLHGDFGRDNLLVLKGKISGIIDWGESKIGDRLYDIAWIYLWNPKLNIWNNYQKYINDKKYKINDLQNRFLACLIEISISSLEWTAENLEDKDYIWLENRVKNILNI